MSNGRVKRFRNQSFWAENGQIRVVDERDGNFVVVNLRDWLERADAFNRGNKYPLDSLDYRKTMQCVEDMITVAKQAKAQGDPHNAADMKHIRNAPINNRIVVPRTSTEPAPKLILPPSYRDRQ